MSVALSLAASTRALKSLPCMGAKAEPWVGLAAMLWRKPPPAAREVLCLLPACEVWLDMPRPLNVPGTLVRIREASMSGWLIPHGLVSNAAGEDPWWVWERPSASMVAGNAPEAWLSLGAGRVA